MKRWFAVFAVLMLAGAVYLASRSSSVPAKVESPPSPKPVEEAPEPMPAAWSTLKGRVVWTGPMPERREIEIIGFQAESVRKALGGRPLLDESHEINPKNRGVKNAVVFLTGSKDTRNRRRRPPIHTSLIRASGGKAAFELQGYQVRPRVLALRKEMALEGRWDPKTHNINFENPMDGRGEIWSPGAEPPSHQTWMFSGPGLRKTPAGVDAPKLCHITCNIQVWVKGFVWLFDHPYFAVTDENGAFEIPLAPCGQRRLVVWHETLAGPFDGSLIEVTELPENNLGELGIRAPDGSSP